MKLKEAEIRKITLDVIERLGEKASSAEVKRTVKEIVKNIEAGQPVVKPSDSSTGRIILTSFGTNQPGVISSITRTFSSSDCDIQDISQKIMGDFYTLVMIVDITNSPKDLREIQEDLNKIQCDNNIKIYLQHEDLFRFMHRI